MPRAWRRIRTRVTTDGQSRVLFILLRFASSAAARANRHNAIVLLNLDAGLTVPGEGPGTGEALPVANRAGVMNYEATRSLDDLRAALSTYGGTALEDAEGLLAYLDLGDRNIHMHVAFGPPFPAVTCGRVEQIP